MSPDLLKLLTQKLQIESSKTGLAPSSAFVLLEWCSILLQNFKSDTETPLPVVLDLIAVDAKALETCLSAGPKPAVKQSALRVTRRALRAVFSSPTRGDDAIRESVRRLTSDATAGQKNAPFLGVISGVCARLPGKKAVLEEEKKAIIAFFVKELVGSKAAPPSHIADALFDFFVAFVSYEDVVSEIIPPLEKAILRAPEVVFSGLVPSLCSALPEEIDLSEVLQTRLLKHLLASMKSNNPAIRQGAVQSFESLLSRSKNESLLLKITSEVVSPLKTQKITNPEHRAAYAQSLSAVLPSVNLSKDVVQGLVPVFAKESNEAALEQEIKAFCIHLAVLVKSNVKVSDDAVSTIVKGSAEKRIPFRKLWQLNVGEIFWRADPTNLINPEVAPLVTKFLSKMKELFTEVSSNPLPSAQSGSLSSAYVFLALAGRLVAVEGLDKATWEAVVTQSLALNPKPSFMLNPRAYSKLTAQAEVQWAVRTLAAVSSSSIFEGAEDAAQVAWGQAFIFAITLPGLHTNFRESAARTLSEVHLKNISLISRVVIDALWAWILSFRTAEKESAPVSAGPESERFLHLVVKALCPSASSVSELEKVQSDLKGQLVKLLILCRTELIPNVSWIALCLRTGTDPGNLVREFPEECMKQLNQVQAVWFLHLPIHKCLSY